MERKIMATLDKTSKYYDIPNIWKRKIKKCVVKKHEENLKKV